MALSALVFVLLRVNPGSEDAEISMVCASVFLGFVIFDLAVAVGMASSRTRRRGSGSSSSLVGLTVLFWFFWVATTGIPTDERSSWTASTGAALVLGVACLAAEFLGVRRLGRVGS